VHRITKQPARSLILAFLLLSGFCVTAEAETYSLQAESGTDSVYIESKAKLEFFDATGKDLAGSFQFDPANPSAGAAGVLRFDLRTLNTGIELRNEHMRDRHLHTDKYPYCYYELTSVTGLPNSIAADSTYAVSGKGWFYIHGVKRELPCQITFQKAASGYVVIAAFAVVLDDFNIPRPKAVFMKLAEVIEVTVIFTGSSGNSDETVTLPTDWKELK
jgi:polyisoprenoid-binding protein YceI